MRCLFARPSLIQTTRHECAPTPIDSFLRRSAPPRSLPAFVLHRRKARSSSARRSLVAEKDKPTPLLVIGGVLVLVASSQIIAVSAGIDRARALHDPTVPLRDVATTGTTRLEP